MLTHLIRAIRQYIFPCCFRKQLVIRTKLTQPIPKLRGDEVAATNQLEYTTQTPHNDEFDALTQFQRLELPPLDRLPIQSDNDYAAKLYLRLAMEYAERSNVTAAEVCYLKSLRLNPTDVAARNNYGAMLLRGGRYQAAVHEFDIALKIKSDMPQARCNLGIVYQELGRPMEALQQLHEALRIAPMDCDILSNVATLERDLGNIDTCLTLVQQCLSVNSNHPNGRYLLSLLQLAEGGSKQAWEDYEYRKFRNLQQKGIDVAAWTGQELEGATIVVLAEQGIGDQILFASFVSIIIERASTTYLVCTEKLVQLFRDSFPRATVVSESELGKLESEIAANYQVSIASLGLYLAMSVGRFGGKRPYLCASRQLREKWRSRLDRLGSGLKIGISWRGGTTKTGQMLRSIDLTHWKPILLIAGVHFISLQYGENHQDIGKCNDALGIKIHDFAIDERNYADTAALTVELDLIITVSTSIVSLACALGAEVWVFTPVGAGWMYGLQSRESGWLPSARLFRQRHLNDWNDAVVEVSEMLSRRLSA